MKEVVNLTTRPLADHEYRQVIELLIYGFQTDGGERRHPNPQIAMALQLQASLGLRIGDVLALRVNNFRNGKLETVEKKTKKIQYRDVNPAVIELVKDYALKEQLTSEAKIFNIGVRAVQLQLKFAVDHLGLDHIGTHSFRKMYATRAYSDSGNDIKLVKDLLNHATIATTERYIKINQFQIDRVSRSMNFLI
jgi:integrase